MESVQDLEALVNIAIATGSALGAIGLVIATFVWRIAVSMRRVATLEKGLVDHDNECKAYRIKNETEVGARFDKVDDRLDQGSEHFTQIERSLGRIEGALEIADKSGDRS